MSPRATPRSRITKQMTVGEVMRRYPQLYEVFEEHGLTFCAGCYVALSGSIEQGAGYNAIRHVDELVQDLNNAASS
jgi:hybrid cluster-associated redox disulfide protein